MLRMSIADDATHFGRQVRALRRRRRLRQSDVAAAADLSQATVSAVERGHSATLSLVTLQQIASVVDARVRLVLTWRGGDLDRLTDERHARLASEVARLLRSMGWQVQAEVTFAFGRDHGSVDLLAWHAATRTLLVVEIKTVLASSEEMLRRLDTKTRLGPNIARRFGWRPAVTGRLVVHARDAHQPPPRPRARVARRAGPGGSRLDRAALAKGAARRAERGVDADNQQ